VTADYMRAWGKHTHGSPLYARLVEVVADDPDLLRVVNRITHGPPPNLLFAAVQYLMQGGAGPDLARHYLSMVADPLPPDGVGPVFTRFVLEHEEEIVDLGNTRYTQTNESRRCVALLPMAMMAGFDRFHLVDVGASAGLNLGLDRYHYRFGDVEWGPGSQLTLVADTRGVPPVLNEIEVLSRIGLDLNPLDPNDADARRWLEALIWPEREDRRMRLRSAFEVMSEVAIEMVPGDATETLPVVLDSLPGDDPVVVMNSFALNQVSPDGRQTIDEVCTRARERRPVHRVMMEVIDESDAWARLIVDDGSGPVEVGQAHPHGVWIELY
jgi:hypothetical protein